MRRRHDAGVLLAIRRIAAFFSLLLILWFAGLWWFAARIPAGLPDPAQPVDASEKTDAIVVLTGGAGRLSAGFALLEQGAARKLFISGVYDGVAVRELMNLTAKAKAKAEQECCVVLGYAADNTIGNAAETSDWMEEEEFTSLRLVTANYHMPRSMLEFSMAMPDVRVIPHPVTAPSVHVEDWWRWPGTARLITLEYSKYLVTLVRWQLAQWLEDEAAE